MIPSAAARIDDLILGMKKPHASKLLLDRWGKEILRAVVGRRIDAVSYNIAGLQVPSDLW
jgi:hypothetical protein